jgi:hypothetical protein
LPKYAAPRTASVPAPGGSHGPIAAQKGGSSGHPYAPPALGLPAMTNSRIAMPMPMMPAMVISAVVNAPAANTTREPMP